MLDRPAPPPGAALPQGRRSAPATIGRVAKRGAMRQARRMISSDMHIFLSFLLTFGVPMFIAYRELKMVKPKRPKGGGDGNALVDPPPTKDPDGDDALPPLPQSLLDAAKGRPAPAKPKVLEPV
ncbi:MAG: hypothetical protein EA356_05540 [Geminicoccaceae bacterium]|nr:MAG: hypothetical protein EA356_05540 [Geminicoccaceae bacterium]